ncbi:MAG TPA: cbb3-type cytochrome c oxidase subunit II, partial [Bryobacteraceae bacterium]|nr:cbb3-type cytochrome c oxidase subunit II [Bryobacteraceae bacterium]
ILASVYLGMDVMLVTTNLLLSLRGGTALVGRDIPLRFVWTGVVLYLVVSLQGSMQAMMPVNRFVHFTDWVIGHSHLAMIGFGSMIAAGGLAHVWQRIPGTRYNERFLAWSYWLIITGLGLMVIDLTMAGVVEGQLWDSGAPWIASVRAARPYWDFRTLTGIPIILGFLFFWVGLLTGPAAISTTTTQEVDIPDSAGHDDRRAAAPVGWLGSVYAGASVGGLGFFALSFLVLGIIPARDLQAEINRTIPHDVSPPTAAEQRGRFIYGRDGCAYCHTQQIRTTLADIARFGSPTAAWETQYDYPQLWGTRRIGPDLAREAGVRSDDWQLTHLYNPRLVVRDSVMPAYPYMFNGSASQPNQEAVDLLAYIRSLGWNGKVARVDLDAIVPSVPAMAGMTGREPPTPAGTAPLNGNEAVPMTGGADASAPVFHPSTSTGERVAEAQRGAELFAANCASCHGEKADGHSTASDSLLPKPANLLASRFTDERLSAVLWNGVYGSAMPAWREYSERDLRNLVAFIQQQPRAAEDHISVDTAAIDKAHSLFTEHCASCHGEGGDGRGPAAGALAPAPTNFHLEQPTRARALDVLDHGVPGTAMPAWTGKLSDADRQLLSGYLRSFFATPTIREKEQSHD